MAKCVVFLACHLGGQEFNTAPGASNTSHSCTMKWLLLLCGGSDGVRVTWLVSGRTPAVITRLKPTAFTFTQMVFL